jgi:hypothetical protein
MLYPSVLIDVLYVILYVLNLNIDLVSDEDATHWVANIKKKKKKKI